MPPRIRRESPSRREARIRKHLPKAREYWARWPAYLAADDLCQAGEKAWGAVVQLTKVVATDRGWQHYGHEEIRAAIRAIADASPDEPAIRRALLAAESLHGNFYEIHLDRRGTELAIEDAAFLMQTLWDLLPEQYTGGITFAQWMATDPKSETETGSEIAPE